MVVSFRYALQTIKKINTQRIKLYIFRVFKCISSEKETENDRNKTDKYIDHS